MNNVQLINHVKMKTILLIVIFLTSTLSLYSQKILDEYVALGLQNNEIIQRQEINLERSFYALKEAKSLFAPTISFNGNYTLARGGRTIDLPVGDLLNPVYSSLNQLTNTAAFPQINNVSELLNPNNFYDVKIKTLIPMLNAEMIYNKRIKQQEVVTKEIALKIYRRELIKDIKLAYYNVLKAHEAVLIYTNALNVVEESHRVNQALYANDKINRTAVVRSENELTKRRSDLEIAKRQEQNAHHYFNFLINRELNEPIALEKHQTIPEIISNATSENREEIQQLEKSIQIYDQKIQLEKSYLLPKINAFVDVGSQGFDFAYNNKTQYLFGGISLEWNLFAGNKYKHKLKQAILESEEVKKQTEHLERQLALQLTQAETHFLENINRFKSAESQRKASQKYHEDMRKLYKEGQVLFIELLDAQNEWINAQIQENIYRFELWASRAEVERASQANAKNENNE